MKYVLNTTILSSALAAVLSFPVQALDKPSVDNRINVVKPQIQQELPINPIKLPPDLIISDLKMKGTPKAGECTNFEITIKNIGRTRFNGGGRVTLRPKMVGQSTWGRTRQFGWQRPLNPGESNKITVMHLHFPAQGEYTVGAVFDSTNRIRETNENNNTYTARNIRVNSNC